MSTTPRRQSQFWALIISGGLSILLGAGISLYLTLSEQVVPQLERREDVLYSYQNTSRGWTFHFVDDSTEFVISDIATHCINFELLETINFDVAYVMFFEIGDAHHTIYEMRSELGTIISRIDVIDAFHQNELIGVYVGYVFIGLGFVCFISAYFDRIKTAKINLLSDDVYEEKKRRDDIRNIRWYLGGYVFYPYIIVLLKVIESTFDDNYLLEDVLSEVGNMFVNSTFDKLFLWVIGGVAILAMLSAMSYYFTFKKNVPNLNYDERYEIMKKASSNPIGILSIGIFSLLVTNYFFGGNYILTLLCLGISIYQFVYFWPSKRFMRQFDIERVSIDLD